MALVVAFDTFLLLGIATFLVRRGAPPAEGDARQWASIIRQRRTAVTEPTYADVNDAPKGWDGVGPRRPTKWDGIPKKPDE